MNNDEINIEEEYGRHEEQVCPPCPTCDPCPSVLRVLSVLCVKCVLIKKKLKWILI
mgnify:CR=1 FL=1